MARKRESAATAPPAWRNRMVGHGDAPADQLLANPRNARIHPRFQQDALAAVLDQVGWVQDVIVNQRTGFVVDGHARIALALSRNERERVPVTYVDLTEAEEALILATFDPLSALAGTDTEQLDALLAEVRTDSDALQSLIDDLAVRSGLRPPPAIDPTAEWAGMPAYRQENQEPVRQIIVSFASHADVADFAELIGQTFTDKTKSIWYPERPFVDRRHLAYVEGEAVSAA